MIFSKASYNVSVVVANSSIMELQRRSLLLEVAPGKNEVGHLDLSVAEFLAGIQTTRLAS